VLWKDGRKLKKTLQCHWMTPIYHDGYVYGLLRPTYRAAPNCVALNWKTGKVMWSEKRLTRTSLLMIDGHFICLGRRRHAAPLEGEPEGIRRDFQL